MSHKFIIALVLVSGCALRDARGIEGMYIRESVGEFSRASDTLIIYDCDKKTGGCLVQRNTGFTRIKGGIAQAKERRSEKMSTDYNEGTGKLTDRKTGRVFSFKAGGLLFGTAEFRKVNQ